MLRGERGSPDPGERARDAGRNAVYRRLFPGGGSVKRYYAWLIVAAGAMTIFSCIGLARFAYGMLLPSMAKALALGYDRMGFITPYAAFRKVGPPEETWPTTGRNALRVSPDDTIPTIGGSRPHLPAGASVSATCPAAVRRSPCDRPGR